MHSHPEDASFGTLRSLRTEGQHPKEMDTVDFGELYAYTAVDIYTREAQVVMLPGLTGQDGRMALEIVMAYFGSCEVLQTDGGKEFEGEFSHGIL